MKKKLLISLSIFTFILLTVLSSFFLNRNSRVLQNTSLVIPTPSQSVPNPYLANGTKKIFVEADSPFNITQDLATNAYLISIVRSPFEEVRQKAETTFLEKLNITKEDACNLKVLITTMRFANPDQAGQTFHLSFCTAP
jgi:hypothetical protein